MLKLVAVLAALLLGVAPAWAQSLSAQTAGAPWSGANVATAESTSSTSYTDLTTSGPSVTTTMAGTTAIVCMFAQPQKSVATTGNTAVISVAVSGATTLAATDANGSAMAHPYGTSFTGNYTLARCVTLTGLTAGVNTFKMQYRVDGSTFSFQYRSIAVYAP